MKFVFFGYDFMADALQRLMMDGHEPLAIFSFPCDKMFSFNHVMEGIAQERNIPFSVDKPTKDQIEELKAQGAEVFLSAGYPYKIPYAYSENTYGINVHPALLPKGRGIMPAPHIIMGAHEASGVTVHKLEDSFDTGDILYQVPVPITPDEDVETLSCKIAYRAPDILSAIFADIKKFWDNAARQDEKSATHFPPPSDDMRHIEWDMSTEEINKKARAFGRFGVSALIEGQPCALYSIKAWEEKHPHPPGVIAAVLSRELLMTTKDGFVCIKEFQKLD